MMVWKTQTIPMDHYKLPRIINARKIVWIASILLFVMYGIFNSRNFILGPRIQIIEPGKDLITTDSLISIRGFAKNNSFLKLNDRSIYTNKEGYFEEKLLLKEGYNIVQVKGRDRFKNETVEEFRVYYVGNSYN